MYIQHNDHQPCWYMEDISGFHTSLRLDRTVHHPDYQVYCLMVPHLYQHMHSHVVQDDFYDHSSDNHYTHYATPCSKSFVLEINKNILNIKYKEYNEKHKYQTIWNKGECVYIVAITCAQSHY